MKIKISKYLFGVILVSMIGSTAFAAQQPNHRRESPTTTQENKNGQPFVLDNFKVIETTLDHLGVKNDELTILIRQGKKLEDVLKEKKIPVKKFKKEVIKEYYRAVDEGIANKQLTTEQSDQLKAAIKETVKGWLPKK